MQRLPPTALRMCAAAFIVLPLAIFTFGKEAPITQATLPLECADETAALFTTVQAAHTGAALAVVSAESVADIQLELGEASAAVDEAACDYFSLGGSGSTNLAAYESAKSAYDDLVLTHSGLVFDTKNAMVNATALYAATADEFDSFESCVQTNYGPFSSSFSSWSYSSSTPSSASSSSCGQQQPQICVAEKAAFDAAQAEAVAAHVATKNAFQNVLDQLRLIQQKKNQFTALIRMLTDIITQRGEAYPGELEQLIQETREIEAAVLLPMENKLSELWSLYEYAEATWREKSKIRDEKEKLLKECIKRGGN